MPFRVAIFTLNQWALDFAGNVRRILNSIDSALVHGAFYRAGPELELCGYSLEDALFEQDTITQCWSSLLEIISSSADHDIILDIGMPVYNSALYNCRVLIYKSKIICIRAKTSLARSGNYREDRYFQAWSRDSQTVPFRLPQFVGDKIRQTYVPFGSDFVLEVSAPNESHSICIGWEICQELWESKTISAELYDSYGCHLIVNGSGSYWELRKLSAVLDMVKSSSFRGGSCYAYSNHIGCDGQRYVFSGRSCIFDRGNLVAMTPTGKDAFDEVQMITHEIFPEQIEEYRASMGIRSNRLNKPSRIWSINEPPMDPALMTGDFKIFHLRLEKEMRPVTNGSPCPYLISTQLRFEQEIHHYVSLWLWDYLRRSRMRGFVIPLSGGLDSSSVACLVYAMCNYLFLNKDKDDVQFYLKQVAGLNSKTINNPEEICNSLLECYYLSTRHSSKSTLTRAESLSSCIGAKFCQKSLDSIYECAQVLLNPDEKSSSVSLLDQNLQARLRMLSIYHLSGGNRLVLATGNVDEAVVGYLTKYDCSSADINPIGGLCKEDLRSYLKYCCDELYTNRIDLVDTLNSIIEAPPSAELTGEDQRDEDDIGLTYDEISVLGKVRKGTLGCNGPYGTFEFIWLNRTREPFVSKIRCLKCQSPGTHPAQQLAALVKLFFNRYFSNRHKLTVLTPSLHAETYSPDDNRFDHRQFLYPPRTEQYRKIDQLVSNILYSSSSSDF